MSDPAPINPAAAPPQKIGNYPIDKELGRGGMGVVYLARDPRLNRPVAIKVLPAAFVADPLRLQRFEREARTLAALNHKNVAMIFGLEDSDGQRLLVLEFVPGLTLTQRLSRGALPLDECLRICIQIAEGLEAAHERDVVHRDLKPDNLKITPEGVVKILDFGLATQQQTAHADSDAATATGSALTMAGMVMGTPGYMSPEQARGMPTDKRADIWAFGCVLYEMLTGQKAFYGETVSDCIAAILEHEPDFAHLPARTPNRLRDLLRKCFIKDARRRMRDVGDARIELEDILVQPQSGWYQAAGASAARPAATARLVMPLAPAASQGTPELVLANSARSALAVAPDGSAVAFIAGRPPSTQLWIRRMDALEARPVPGSNGADAPFFSFDSTKVAFFAEGKLKRVALSGGAPFPLAAAPRHQGGCWDSADSICFIPDWQKPLLHIQNASSPQPAAPEQIAAPDAAAGELALIAPEILPGQRHALVTVWTGSSHDESLISAIDLRSGARKPLIHGGANPRYLTSGHILYSRGGTLMAVAFDYEKVEVHGSPIAVEDRVLGNALGGSAQFAAGADGTLVFAVGAVYEPTSIPCLTLKSGEPVAVTPDRKPFAAPRIAPNGRHLCVQVQGAADHLFLYDLERSGSPAVRLTYQGDNACPCWSPDGTRIAFRSTATGRPEIVMLRVDTSGSPSGAQTPEPIFHSDRAPTPCCFAGADGRTLVFTHNRAAPASGLEIWAVEIGSPDSARVVVQSPTSAWGAAVSPDGRHIAYVSDETGRAEVYIQPFGSSGAGGAGGAPRRQVSTEGGAAPVWARNGGELFFRSGDSIIAVRIAVEPSFMVGRPRTLYQGPALPPTLHTANYDVMADGQFLILRAAEDPTHVTSLSVVLNYFTELRRRVPPPVTQTASMVSRMSQMSYGSGATPARATPNAPHPTPRPQQAFPSDMKTIG